VKSGPDNQQFEQVGVEGFIKLLNDLQVSTKDLTHEYEPGWVELLIDTIQSSEKIQHLWISYWELLAGLVVDWRHRLVDRTYNPQIMISLQDAKEWDKLVCWIGVVWLVWPPEGGKTTGEDLELAMLLLFHQLPGALQKLEEQMEQWSGWIGIPESFKQICKQVHDKAAQQAVL